MDNDYSGLMIQVTDMMGRELLQKELSKVGRTIELDLSKYAKGIYFVSVWMNDVKSTQRLIIE